jgi:hypothetical protein
MAGVQLWCPEGRHGPSEWMVHAVPRRKSNVPVLCCRFPKEYVEDGAHAPVEL